LTRRDTPPVGALASQDIPEVYIDSALAVLREELPGQILAMNQRYSDFDLPTPDPDVGYAWGVETGFQPPFVEVGAPDMTSDQFSIELVDGMATTTMIVRGWMAIDESITSNEMLARANYRMARALRLALSDSDAWAGARVLSTRTSVRLNPETRELDVVTGSAVLTYQLEDVERLT